MKLSDYVAAFERGEIVQWEGKPGVWDDKRDNHWDSRYEYRLKPKPLEVWVNIYENDRPRTSLNHPTEAQARAMASPDALRTAVHMKEVV